MLPSAHYPGRVIDYPRQLFPARLFVKVRASALGHSRWFRDARDRSVQPPTPVDVIASRERAKCANRGGALNHRRCLPFCLGPVARLEPASRVGRKLASYGVVVERQVLGSQHAAPIRL